MNLQTCLEGYGLWPLEEVRLSPLLVHYLKWTAPLRDAPGCTPEQTWGEWRIASFLKKELKTRKEITFILIEN